MILRHRYPKGAFKNGELEIYHVKDLYGYAVDFVIVDPDDPKVQTLEHVKYYMDKLDDGIRFRIRLLKNFFVKIVVCNDLELNACISSNIISVANATVRAFSIPPPLMFSSHRNRANVPRNNSGTSTNIFKRI